MPQNNPFNFFYYAEKSTEKEFIEQVNRTDSKILDTALSTLQMREMLLPLILRYQSATAFSAFLEKVSPDVLVKAMDYKDKLFYSPLMYAAGYQDSKGFIALLNKVPSASINATLPQVSDVRREGVPLQSCAASSTVLHIAAELQPAEGFKKLLEKITIHLDSLIPLVNEEGWTFLHIAAKYQSGENFIKLLYPQYISESALDEAVLRKTPGGKTPLHLAARYQSHATIHHMLNIVGLGVIFKLVENNKDDFDEIRLLLSDAFFVYRVQDQYKSVLYDTILKYFTPLPVLTRLLNLIWIRIQQGDVLLPSLSIRKKIIEALVTPERLLGVKKRAFFQYLKKNTPDVNEGEWLSARVAQHIEARKSVETLPPEYILALTQAAEDIPESRILPACEAPAHIVEKITHNKTPTQILTDGRI